MNALIDRFPSSVEIDGVEYGVNSDFRVGVDIMLAFEDDSLTAYEKQLVMLQLLYEETPPDPVKAQDMAVLFLNCGEDGEGQGGEPPQRLYSFAKDAKYIYSAIRQTHGIDLETVDMHWWKFCYLLLDLDSECFFQQIIHLRRQKRAGKLTKEERIIYSRMQDILELNTERDAEYKQAEQEFMAQFSG